MGLLEVSNNNNLFIYSYCNVNIIIIDYFNQDNHLSKCFVNVSITLQKQALTNHNHHCIIEQIQLVNETSIGHSL